MLQKESLGSVRFISINRKKLIKKLKEIAGLIKERNPEVIDIRLFGSMAQKKEIGTSDADILIILNDSEENYSSKNFKI